MQCISSGLRSQPPPGQWGSPQGKEVDPKSCHSFVIPLWNLPGSFACSLCCNQKISRDVCIWKALCTYTSRARATCSWKTVGKLCKTDAQKPLAEVLEGPWDFWATSWRVFGNSGWPWMTSWAYLGVSWGDLGSSWAGLGSSRDPLGSVLGGSWSHFGAMSEYFWRSESSWKAFRKWCLHILQNLQKHWNVLQKWRFWGAENYEK